MRDWNVSLLKALVIGALAVGLPACGDDDDDDEGGGGGADTQEQAQLPTEFTGQFLQIRGGTPEAPRELGARLSADGTRANISFDVAGREPRESGSGRCGGESYDEISSIEGTTPGTLRISGFGTAQLEADRTAIAFQGPPPPVCDERAGSWRGTEGDLQGRSGTFRYVGTHARGEEEGTLTLEEE